VGIGVVIGIVVVLALADGSWQPTILQSVGLLAAYMAVMMTIRMLASIRPHAPRPPHRTDGSAQVGLND
jgi:hypothetical protein